MRFFITNKSNFVNTLIAQKNTQVENVRRCFQVP